MYMLEIAALDNGAHNNQTFHGFLPDGWAIVPDEMTLENFPFGEVTAEEIDGVMTVTSWKPLPIPEPEEPDEPIPEPEPEKLTVWDELDAAYKEGVDGAYDE